MKRVEIEQKRQQVEEDWQKRGVGGLVSVVDAARWTITIKVRSIGGSRDLAIHVTNHTVLRRYAPDSVKFSDAKPGTFDQIKPGDQLRALGARSADGNELTAQEIVSGSFRNIAGTVASVDAGAHEISVMDLITKRPIVVKFTADSQLRNMPPMMAQAVAARLKRGTPGASGGGERPPGGEGNGGAGPGPGSSAGAEHPFGGAAVGHGPGGAPDLQQMLNRLPPARLTDLQKGEAVMIVSTQGAAPTEVTAITLLSGVEPILTASASSGAAQPMLLSPWSLSAPAGDAANP